MSVTTPTSASTSSKSGASVVSAKKSKKPKWAFIALLIAVVAIVGWYFGSYLPGTQPLELAGLVQAKEVKNASRFGGRVLAILVKEGEQVKEGQPLVRFDDVELRAQIADARATLTQAQARKSLLLAGTDSGDLKQASAKVEQASQELKILSQGATLEQVEQAKTTLANAKLKLESSEAAYKSADRMLDEGIISRQRYQEIISGYDASKSQYAAAEANLKSTTRGARPEDLQIARAQLGASKAQYQKLAKGAKRQDLEIADASIAQAQSNLDALEAQLSEVTLKAPISGVITMLTVSEGELVQPARPVVTIIDSENLWVDVFVPESQLAQVQVGQKVRVIPSAIDKVWYDGTVSSISMKSEFVPEGQSASNDKGEEASFRVKVMVPGNAPPQGKPEREDLFLRAGMNVHIAF
ncbi:MAG: HlyD family efflux transporter periplasmic adaptor subunit [Vampirovibrionales bacterium]|nr:HlyD family efflux transporter periplasmic adaptor subunit [Vampirovibrionales bacterium]